MDENGQRMPNDRTKGKARNARTIQHTNYKKTPNKRAADEDDDEKANERKGTERSHILKN